MKVIYKIVLYCIKFIVKIIKFPKLKKDISSAQKEIDEKYRPQQMWSDNDLIFFHNEMKYDLSLIIPVYNSQSYLEQCILSLINQETQYKYQLIFVNDGSKDNSLNILKKYEVKYDFIKVITQANSGVSVARNTGISNSEGTYIGFIDADDYIKENYVQVLLSEAYKNNCDMVKGSYYEVNNEELREIHFRNKYIDCNKNREELYLVKGHPWGSVIKRELFKKVRFPVGYWYEDMIMRFLIISQCNNVQLVDECLYFYRIVNNSLSRKKTNSYKCLEQYYLLKHIIEKYEEMKLKKDELYYKNILNEIGPVLWLRTRNLDKQTQKNIFLLACNLESKYDKEYKKLDLNFVQSYIAKSLRNRDYYLWYLISIYYMIKEKYL